MGEDCIATHRVALSPYLSFHQNAVYNRTKRPWREKPDVRLLGVLADGLDWGALREQSGPCKGCLRAPDQHDVLGMGPGVVKQEPEVQTELSPLGADRHWLLSSMLCWSQ